MTLLEGLARQAAGAPQTADNLHLIFAVVQHLASPKHLPLPLRDVFLPDRAGVLVASHELMYDDAPWLGDVGLQAPNMPTPSSLSLPSAAAQWRRVHPDVAHEVAERLGAQSLRRWLISRNADNLALGQSSIEAFGQYESLTSRLHNILELYADGVGILHELIQNADDAGATKVGFLLDEAPGGDSSLLSPMMRAWQGPALYAYNNSTFKPHDFRNICSIGSNAKLAVISAYSSSDPCNHCSLADKFAIAHAIVELLAFCVRRVAVPLADLALASMQCIISLMFLVS